VVVAQAEIFGGVDFGNALLVAAAPDGNGLSLGKQSDQLVKRPDVIGYALRRQRASCLASCVRAEVVMHEMNRNGSRKIFRPSSRTH